MPNSKKAGSYTRVFTVLHSSKKNFLRKVCNKDQRTSKKSSVVVYQYFIFLLPQISRFITWLQEAEEESDDDDDDDDGDEEE